MRGLAHAPGLRVVSPDNGHSDLERVTMVRLAGLARNMNDAARVSAGEFPRPRAEHAW